VLSFTASPPTPDANLDIRLALYDGSGNLITSSNPSGLSASLNRTVSAGTYYLAVDGVGVGTGATGYTDYASLGQFTLTGTIPSSPSGQPPVAAVAASVSSGFAPLAVSFSSAGSYDPDGTALTYDWDFGDGTSSTEANPSHIYTLRGSYTASLAVFDATGLSSTASTVITVQGPADLIYVAGITMSKTSNGRGTQAKAVVLVKDAAGNVKPNVTVTGTWSGLTSGTSSGKTGSTGTATLSSAWSKKAGTFTFTVTGLSLINATYDSARNVESSDFIVK
jgi:PKD repeat protein